MALFLLAFPLHSHSGSFLGSVQVCRLPQFVQMQSEEDQGGGKDILKDTMSAWSTA